jgi:hypothetical protein
LPDAVPHHHSINLPPHMTPVPHGSLGMNTLSHHQRMSRSSGAQSPPLPPPPPPEDEHEAFGRPRTSGVMPIVPDEEDLPGWVPKNYIEKGFVLYNPY